jgi:hypothetical protein
MSAERFAAAHRTARILLQELEARRQNDTLPKEVSTEQVLLRLEALAAKTRDDEALRRALEEERRPALAAESR